MPVVGTARNDSKSGDLTHGTTDLNEAMWKLEVSQKAMESGFQVQVVSRAVQEGSRVS